MPIPARGYPRLPDARLLYAILVAASIVYCLPLFDGPGLYGRHDWDQFSFRYELVRLALLRDHQLPFWNPYANGGNVLLAHPNLPFPSPWSGLVLLFGVPLGLKIQVVLFMALGATGMAALLRQMGLALAGCAVGGIVFMMSAHFALHIAEGHLEWCVLGLMPWVALCLLRAPERPIFIALGGLLLASILTFGAVYVPAVYAPFLTVWAGLESIRRRSFAIIGAWLGIATIAVLLSAVKLAPQVMFVNENAREVEAEGFALRGFADVLLNPRQAFMNRATHDWHDRERRGMATAEDWETAGRAFDPFARSLPASVAIPEYERLRGLGLGKWKWHEYGGYITLPALLLAALGIALFWRTRWPWYAAGLLAAATMAGSGFPIDLWSALRELPLYEQLRVPSRFMAALVFVLAVAAGHGADWLHERFDRGRRRIASWLTLYVVPAIIYAELAVLGWTLFGDVFVGERVDLPRHEQFAIRYTTLESENPRLRGYLHPMLLANSGVIEGYENLEIPHGAVAAVGAPEYLGEAWLTGTGRASIHSWTMSRVIVELDVESADALVLNQNFAPGWRARISGGDGSREATAVGYAGLVSVPVLPGDREADLWYHPPGFTAGAAISAATLAACLAWLLIAWRRRRPA